MKLSDQEEQVLDNLLSANRSVVAIRLKISRNHINVVLTNARRKEAAARKFLRELKKYERVLHPKPRYRGI